MHCIAFRKAGTHHDFVLGPVAAQPRIHIVIVHCFAFNSLRNFIRSVIPLKQITAIGRCEQLGGIGAMECDIRDQTFKCLQIRSWIHGIAQIPNSKWTLLASTNHLQTENWS